MSAQKALKEVRQQFAKAGGAPLDAAAKKEFLRIFELTIGKIIAQGQKAGVDVWASRRFRAWVLLETRKIARESAKRATGANATSAAALTKGALTSMRKTSKKVLAASKTDIAFWQLGIFIDRRFEETPVCGDWTKLRDGDPAR
jgi:hypothetical protein